MFLKELHMGKRYKKEKMMCESKQSHAFTTSKKKKIQVLEFFSETLL